MLKKKKKKSHHPELHSKFKKSLGYMRPDLTKPQKVLRLEENREGTDLDYENWVGHEVQW